MSGYLRPRLFDPLGIGEVGWLAWPPGREQGFSGLFARTEDIAKLGLLYLQRGRRGDTQLIPESYVSQATSRQRSTTSGQSWVADPVATRLSQVDRFGNRLPNSLNLSDPLRYQPQVFEFDPSDSNIVVIGLRHAGVLVSIDRGVSWGRLPVTVPLVSSVVFAPERGHFYFSTYSRGVWEVWLGASKLAIAAPQTLSTGQLKLTSSLKDMDSGALAGQPVVLQLLNSKGVLVQKISATTSTKGVATAIFNKPPSPGIYYFRAIYAGGKAILGTQTQRRYLKP